MKKTVFSLAICLLFVLSLPAYTTAAQTPNKINPNTSERSAGTFEVHVFKQEQWHNAGLLEYHKYLRERKIDLSGILPAEENIRIKLIQKGGGAAHIDSIMLGDRLPVKVSGCDEKNVVTKLMKSDYDVVDAYQKTLEFTFDKIEMDKSLQLTARVEPVIISKTPFQFPTANLFKQINENSKFYSYKLKSSENELLPDKLGKTAKPFIREFCRTGSGHPSGFTYGWVNNDVHNLYIKLDFTPDNTRDGNKDYAKVYINTTNGLQTFKISETYTKWGVSDFTYTDAVSYQHKKYDFKIPLKEIGLKDPEKDTKVLMAFSAYGTAFPATPGPLIDAGFRHTVGLKLDGTLWSAGQNTDGQLGNGTTNDSAVVVQELSASTNWVAVSAGYSHTAALKSDGTLWAWGDNTFGQIGDGTSGNIRTVPTIVMDTAVDPDTDPDTDWVAVSAGQYHTVGLKSDGTLWAWGRNYNGQLGDGTNTNSSTPVQVPGNNDWVVIDAGNSHTLALKSNGTLWAWGHNFYGQLGDGTREVDRDSPVQIGTQKDWIAVSAGSMHSAARKSDGTLYTWGFNGYGQLGAGTVEEMQLSPVIVMDTTADPDTDPDTDWVGVAVNDRFTLALKSDGTLWAWGYNWVGQLGNGTNGIDADSIVPVQEATLSIGWFTIAAGYQHAVAAMSDGSLWTWGWNSSGQLADGTTVDKNSPNWVGDASLRWLSIDAGAYHSIATLTDGSLWTWGNNDQGQLGDDTRTHRDTPLQEITLAYDWAEVAGGQYHSVALKSDGTVWAWGFGLYGQLGDNSNSDRLTPVQENTGADDWVAVAAGIYHTVALKSDGAVWSWGQNVDGQLGNNSTAPESWIPVREDTNANDWVAIAAGGHHTLALKSNGDLYAWGNNFSGQLGNGSTTSSNVPVLVLSELSDWVAVAAGAYHSLALKSDGTLWCWGENGYGQLGLGSGNFTDTSYPERESTNGNEWASIAAGDNHTIAIKANGTLWAWGMGNYGQLGNESPLHSPTPVQEDTSSSQWVTAKAGLLHSIAMQADGSLWTWGDNTYGQLGDGTTENKIIPNQISVPGEEDLDVDGLPDVLEQQIIEFDPNDNIQTLDDVLPDDDFDDDGLTNLGEAGNNTNPTDPDSDDDGVLDGNEVENGTNPNVSDTDGDGENDGTDNCPLVYNSDQQNFDGDAQGDACDPDDDNDGVPDGDDAFPMDPNETTDSDGDGIGDNSDNCPNDTNPDQIDSDEDGIGDVCDTGLGDGSACDDAAECSSGNCVNAVTATWYPANVGACCPIGEYWFTDHCEACAESDGDEVCDSLDNCPDDSNSDQADNDGDGVGNVCDNCPSVPNANQSNTAPNGEGDACQGLMAHYPFNGIANDLSGNGYDGSVNGASLGADRFGNLNNAYIFDGTDDFIIIDNTADLNFTSGGFTLMAWVNFTENNIDSQIIAKHICGSFNGYWLGVDNNRFLFYVNNDPRLLTTETYNDGNWHFVVGIYDDTNQYLYVDGVLKDSQPISYTNTNDADLSIGIGRLPECGISSTYFNGSLDDLRVYNRALSQSEIQEIFNESLNQGLVAHYPFDGNANDESINSNHGTVQGAVLAEDRSGNQDSAYSFDGSEGRDDFIEVNHSSSLTFANQLTASAWIKTDDTNAYSGIVNKIIGEAPPRSGFNLSVNELSQFRCDVNYEWPDNYSVVVANVNLADDQWHHVTCMYDGATISAYVDGVLEGSQSYSGGIGENTEPLRIGKDPYSDYYDENRYFTGSIDDIRVHNRTLSESEIQAMYNEGAGQIDTDGDGDPDITDSDDDNDGLSDVDELTTYFTDPFNLDSDGDGINDGVEVAAGSDPKVSTSVPVYTVDDFYEDTLDPTKWQRYEFIRRIKDGKLESAITRYDSPGSNNLLFSNPAEVTSFQADVSVIDVSEDDFNPKARLTGSFFNDGTTGDGATGDILIEFGIRDTDSNSANGLAGYYWIGRCENSDCTDVNIPDGYYNEPPGWGPVALGDAVTMKLTYSQADNSFTLNFGGQNLVIVSPFPYDGTAADPYKLIGTRISNIVTGQTGFIHATFDNVYKNQALDVYDDFQTAMIDNSNWQNWEFIRRASNGVLESAIARYDTNGGNHLTFTSPHTIRGYQADVTVTDFENNDAFLTARLAGAFYNDGTPGLEWTGDIIAEVGIAHNGFGLVSFYSVARCLDDCNLQGNWNSLIYRENLVPVELNETYRLSIVWDESNDLFTFKFDEFTASYDPTVLTPMATGPRLEFNGIGTRVSGIGAQGEWGYIEAKFDNVVVLNQVEEVDSDEDGIRDPIDNCPNDYNPDQANADGDIFGDVCDNCPNDANNDADVDGDCGDVDNCPMTYNPEQEDVDEDTIGDACDNCPKVSNSGQEDGDGDGMGNACEPGGGFVEQLTVVDTDPNQPGEPLPKQPGEPLWITATFENNSPEPIETIKPDCFNTSFHVTDSAGNTLPPRYRIRAAYGIPKDVVTLPPGPFSVTCDLAEMFPPEVLKDPVPADGEPEPYTVVATYSNDIQDPDLNPVTGACSNPPCSDLFVGAVTSPPATVKIEGTSVETMTANCSIDPGEWNPQWAVVSGPVITVSILSITDSEGSPIGVETVEPSTIILNGKLKIIPGSARIENNKLLVDFDGSEAVKSMGTVVPGQAFTTMQGNFKTGDAVFSGQGPVYILYPIDIKPGSYPNSIDPGSKGTVPVAILGTPDFDVATVDAKTVTLAGAPVKMKKKNDPMASLEDVNKDGYQDMVVHIDTQKLDLAKEATVANLEGKTLGDTPDDIKGVDTVKVVPEKNKKNKK